MKMTRKQARAAFRISDFGRRPKGVSARTIAELLALGARPGSNSDGGRHIAGLDRASVPEYPLPRRKPPSKFYKTSNGRRYNAATFGARENARRVRQNARGILHQG